MAQASVQVSKVQGRELLVDMTAAEPGPSLVLDQAARDTGNVPTTQLRPGLVLGRHPTSGRYYEADHVLVEKSRPATVTSKIALGAGAASKTFKFLLDPAGPEFTVTGGAGDTTAALWAAKLNADPRFASRLVARDDGTGKLVVESLHHGSEGYFKVTAGTLNGQGGAPQDTFDDEREYRGEDGEYYVLDIREPIDMLDASGVARDQVVGATLRRGHFKKTKLLALTEDARKVLLRRGSYFV
jgi:hypothetical protein